MFTKPSIVTRGLVLLTGAALALLGAGCTYSTGDVPNPCNASTQTITYAGVISPIFDANCRFCHSSQAAATLGGGNDFGSHATIKRYPADGLLKSIQHAPGYSAMPKGGAKLSDCDIERIERWIAAGAPNN